MNGPDQYGVVGHPINHSWSPFIHGLFAKQTEQSLVYRLYDIAPGEFRAQVLEFFTRGGRGLNVSVTPRGPSWSSRERRRRVRPPGNGEETRAVPSTVDVHEPT